MGRCICGHHEEDHDLDGFSSECWAEDCTCMEFEPEDEEDYDDGQSDY